MYLNKNYFRLNKRFWEELESLVYYIINVNNNDANAVFCNKNIINQFLLAWI